ncbi:MAG: efflux RND transporter permease subunit [Rhodothermales bacterium]|nr:efflux RND transporter permease subunit [Rhodothermales bacterium]MBO6781351.1 efflux RND transporter permease subunit [Rhodothermales bacterium]
MTITNLAIKYRTTVVVLTVTLVLGGIYSYTTIPKEAAPSIEVPNIVVTTVYPGASPDDIESLITQHVEREVQNVNGIKEIRSTSTEGVSSVIIEFEPDISIDEAFSKVRDKVDVARADLPNDVEEPIVSEIDFSEFPILVVNLSAPYPLPRLKEVAEELQDEIEGVPGILEVDLIGGLEREVQIDVDLVALQGYNVAFQDVVDAIRNENTNIPGGSVDVDALNFLVRVDGEFSEPSEISDLVVKSPGGTPIYVRDVANVTFGFKERESYSRLAVYQVEEIEGQLEVVAENPDTLPVISLNVKKRSGENILETVAAVDQVLAEYPFPNGTNVVITGDESEAVEELIMDLENSIISGLIFVIAVLLFFLGVRNATLVGIAIPLSMFISFTVFQALGYTLNFIILFSLIIALGMLVDNAIVIVENIYRFREEGYGRFEAARLATAEVAGAVIASTLTTVAVFVPMLFWPGVIGEFMSYMPLTLIVTLCCSLFVAIIINPVITGIFVRLESEDKPKRSKLQRRVFTAAIVALALMIGLANWKTLVVLAVAVPVLMILHARVMKPIGDRFVSTGLPRLIQRYRSFLDWMLVRDYSVKRAMLRNTAALVSLTAGFVLLVVSGLVSATLGGTSATIVLIPGVILLVIGVLGVVLHSLEAIYIGGKSSVRGGAIFGGISLALLLLMAMGPRTVAVSTIVDLLVLPIIIVVVGALGWAFNKRERLILTDNRSRLLNVSLGAFVAILTMFGLAPTGTEFFPTTDPRQVRITASGPLGMNIQASNQLATEVHSRILGLLESSEAAKDNVKSLLVNVGVGGDFDFGGGGASPERSRVTLNLVDYADRDEPSTETLARIRDQLQGIPGAEIEITQDSNGPPTGAPVNIEISGEEFVEIQRIAEEVKQMLVEAADTGAIPGLVDVRDNLNTGRPELQVEIDRERAARFGLNTSKVASTVRSAINGVEAGKWRDGEDEFDITVRLRESDRASLESLNNLTILDEGRQIPLTAVADLSVQGGLGSVTRLDLDRVATVSGDAAPGANGQAILAQVQQLLGPYQEALPPGYQMAYTGENEEFNESFSFLTIVLLVGVALIFMIMVAQFNSVSAPFIIMVAVGLSLIGVLLGLLLTRTPYGLMTFIGVISLAGIVVNNNIVLVDYAMQLRERGMAKHDAIIEAGATRLRPVLLTAMTTVLGLIPLTFGINIDFVGLLTNLDPNFQFGSENTQFWGPMGTAIISGLTFATFLTLVIVPVMYSVFDSVSERMSSKQPVTA